jgi:SAM-dependent methyltransferase
VRAIILVDARPPRPGRSWFDDAPTDFADHLRSIARDGVLPPWHEWFPGNALEEILPEKSTRDAFIAELPRLPLAFLDEPAPPARWDGPIGYLLLSDPYREVSNRYVHNGAPVEEYLSDHLALLTQPEAIARVLRTLVERILQAGDRRPGLVFGENAESYDDLRVGYPAALVDSVLSYADGPDHAVEAGAGTGKATQLFVERGVRVTCLEPDPGMAAVLARRFGDAGPRVVTTRFEDWTPPTDGVPLLYCAQSFHWLDPTVRCRIAAAALAPRRGALAIFGHRYRIDNEALNADLQPVYAAIAPELMDVPGRPEYEETFADELTGSGLFDDVRTEIFHTDVAFPTERYRRLLATFSNHRMLDPVRRDELHARIGDVVDAHGGSIAHRIVTTLVMGRSVTTNTGGRAW